MALSDRPIYEPEYSILARFFDLLNEKYVPYARQCDFLEEAFHKYNKHVSELLDLASGTGLHAIPLASRGYRVVGIERSPEMLAEARRKAAEVISFAESSSGDGMVAKSMASSGKLIFLQADMRYLQFYGEFDAAFAFNYPVAYCLDHSSLAALLEGVSRALRPGGLFLFDFFSHYNLSLSTQQEEAEADEVRIEIAKEFSLNPLRQVLIEHDLYTIHHKPDGSTHILEGYDEFRVYYPQELIYYLEQMGNFRVLGFHKRWDLQAEPNRSDLVIVAEKKRTGK
jgi:SAM-dependent methyltransferase